MEIISREEYLMFRQEWKETYLKLAKQIRALKTAQKLAAKGGYEAACTLQSMRAKGSNSAHFMMDELEHMKEMSRLSVAFLRFLDRNNSEQLAVHHMVATGML